MIGYHNEFIQQEGDQIEPNVVIGKEVAITHISQDSGMFGHFVVG